MGCNGTKRNDKQKGGNGDRPLMLDNHTDLAVIMIIDIRMMMSCNKQQAGNKQQQE